jgi:hypothetical protein
MIPTINYTDRNKILELINQAPGNYFALKGSTGIKIRTAFYKEKRQSFFEKLMEWLGSDLAGEGYYQVMNGSSKTTEPIFMIQKGSLSGSQAPIIIQEKESSDIQLVKENAELKAKLHYLELQMAELQESLEDSEKALEEAPDPVEKPNPWLSLAEQLAPAAAQIIGALAAKLITPDINGKSVRERDTEPQPMAVRYIRPNVKPDPGSVPGEGSNGSGNLQGNDYPGPGIRNFNTETEEDY